MAITGLEVVGVQAPDLAGRPAAVFTPYTLAQLAQSSLPELTMAGALTAAGNNRATALVLGVQFNNITAAAASTGVLLPPSAGNGQLAAAFPMSQIGQGIFVFNSATGNTIQVYAAGSDTIDGVAGATGVPLSNNKRCIYFCIAAGVWISAQWGAVSA
jgi:hypothetical protein